MPRTKASARTSTKATPASAAKKKASSKRAKTTTPKPDLTFQLTEQFRELRLPAMRDHFPASARRAAIENLSHLEYLSELTTLECAARREGRIKRLVNRSKLPPDKTWDSFKFDRLPLYVTRQLQTLRDGSFLKRRENVLLFGKPGSGKSHALCALAEQLIFQGHSILFTTCSSCCWRSGICVCPK